jgi:hypothetical protein
MMAHAPRLNRPEEGALYDVVVSKQRAADQVAGTGESNLPAPKSLLPNVERNDRAGAQVRCGGAGA